MNPYLRQGDNLRPIDSRVLELLDARTRRAEHLQWQLGAGICDDTRAGRRRSSGGSTTIAFVTVLKPRSSAVCGQSAVYIRTLPTRAPSRC